MLRILSLRDFRLCRFKGWVNNLSQQNDRMESSGWCFWRDLITMGGIFRSTVQTDMYGIHVFHVFSLSVN